MKVIISCVCDKWYSAVKKNNLKYDIDNIYLHLIFTWQNSTQLTLAKLSSLSVEDLWEYDK